MGRAETVATEGIEPEFQLHLVEFDRVGEVSRLSPNTYLDVPTGYLNIFGQQRTGRNEVQGALTDSLEEGQIHAISVVMATPDLIEEYRQFTNKAWDKDVKAESLKQMPETDPFYPGMYPILCAGHSRTEGIREVAKRAGVEPDFALIEARIFDVKSVYDILRIQISENIHSAPNKDSAMRAIGEMYIFLTEQRHGIPPEKAWFRRKYKVSVQDMDDAVNYLELPPYVRALTDDGGLPIGIIKELARARGSIFSNAEYLASRDERYVVPKGATEEARGTINSARQERIDHLVKSELMYLLKGVYDRGAAAGKNILAARNFIKGHARMLRTRNEERESEELILLPGIGDDPETLEGRLSFYNGQVTEFLRQVFAAEEQKRALLARRIAKLVEVGSEAANPELVVETIENGLALARAALPVSVENSANS